MDHLQVGFIGWNEVYPRNADACRAFYCGVFGWTAEEMPSPGMVYTIFKKDGHNVGGMLPMTAEWGDVKPHWMTYVTVADADATARMITEHGGKVCIPPTDLSVGRFAVVEDPDGAVFSIIQWKR
jgi:predicted enzyme related to lactoylglutathione lyase